MHVSDNGLKHLRERTDQLMAKPEARGVLPSVWELLQESEEKMKLLFANKKPGDDVPGEIELGPVLYLLNDMPKDFRFITEALRFLEMPKSTITPQEMEQYLDTLRGPGYVAGDGTLIAGDGSLAYLHKYVQLDPGWALSAYQYVLLKIGIDHKAPLRRSVRTPSVW